MTSTVHITAAAGSDVGQIREGNEDSYFAGQTVFAVADGMGGHQAGEVASAIALEPLQELDGRTFEDPTEASSALVRAIETSNDAVVERSLDDETLRGMGTTLTAVMVQGDLLITAHVGDSRAYLLRAGEPIRQLTTDHTLVERLVSEGRLSRDEAHVHPQRNVITRAIGNEPDVSVDALPALQLLPGDVVMLCSDGLTGPLDDGDIQILIDATGGGKDAVGALIGAANEAGGPDNITVVLLKADGGDSGSANDPEATQNVLTIPPSGVEQSDTATAGARADGAGRADRDVRQIRTTYSGDADWASTMGRLGARQGHDSVAASSPGKGRRVLAAVLAAVVLLGILAGGGYFLLSRAFFIGDYEGQVAIHRGLPETVAGIPLFWVIEDEVSDVAVADLPDFRQADITEGLNAPSLGQARQVVNILRQEVEDGQSDGPSAPSTPTDTPTSATGT